MGLFDDLMAKIRGEASKQAAQAATAGARKAVESVAEDFLSFAEGELASAREARGRTDEEEAPEAVEDEVAPPPSARERREAAEARARDELARLKAELGKTDPSGDAGGG